MVASRICEFELKELCVILNSLFQFYIVLKQTSLLFVPQYMQGATGYLDSHAPVSGPLRYFDEPKTVIRNYL